MADIADDRWTCPGCERTTIVHGSPVDVRAALDAVRKRHSKGHQSAADIIGRLGLPDPIPGRRSGRRRNHRAAP